LDQLEEFDSMLNAHPKLPEFDYVRPETIEQATDFLIAHAGEAQIFLGGTDTLIRIRDGFWRPKYLVDVKGLEGMSDLSFDRQRGLSMGAAVNMNQVIANPEVQEHYQLLADAAQSAASYQLRNRATIVGNICNASPAGDTVGACLLLEGVLTIHGESGVRQETLKTFFHGPGETALKTGDIVTSLHIPLPPKGLKGKYLKLSRNKLSDLAIVGVTVVGYPEKNNPSGYCLKLALASVAPTPLIVDQIESILAGGPITEERLDEAAKAAMEACTPIDDVRGSARYRRYMVRNLSRRALNEVWEQLRQRDNRT
jgi:CO/xanthine dehydrogenase FAD-binding subunit